MMNIHGSLANMDVSRCQCLLLTSSTKVKGRGLTQSYDKSPCAHRMIHKSNATTQNATENFDYTTIADRLRTVGWSNDSYTTGVCKPVYGIQTFPLTTEAV